MDIDMNTMYKGKREGIIKKYLLKMKHVNKTFWKRLAIPCHDRLCAGLSNNFCDTSTLDTVATPLLFANSIFIQLQWETYQIQDYK